MIGTLRGQVLTINSDIVLLEVAGVGYAVHAPISALSSLAVGDTALFYTHLAVREDSLTLYGFTNQIDKDMFELLVSVSGIGPRLGLAILSAYTAGDVVGAIRSDSPELFSSVSGIGKKNAQRIILELKNKLPGFDLVSQPANTTSGELQTALQALGYSPDEIRLAMKEADAAQSLDQQIKAALAHLSKTKF